MKKLNIKKAICILTVCICFIGLTTPVYAQTVRFNVTVGKNSRPDPLSKRAVKADNEQKYYVTAVGFSKNGYVAAYSRKLSGSVASGKVMMHSSNLGVRQTGTYTSHASSGEYYYMETYWKGGAAEFTVTGRYTP